MSYRNDIIDDLNFIADDVETIHDELVDILDIDNIEDIKIAISETIQTINTLLAEIK